MRMAELAERSGLSVPTVKYYLREGLLPAGERTGVNQAQYGAEHVERLRMIRALNKVAGLTLAQIRGVVQEMDASAGPGRLMGVTQNALAQQGASDPEAWGSGVTDQAEARLDRLIRQRGWRCEPQSAARTAAVRAVAELEAERLDAVLGHLDEYAAAAETVGRIDVQTVLGASSADRLVHDVVLGSVLRRPLLEALILLAQQHATRELEEAGAQAPGTQPSSSQTAASGTS